jgi:flagellar motor switch/type III secretory pathway protein FliN
MLMSPSLALSGLKRIDPDHAQLKQMMLALLDGEKHGSELSLRARVAEPASAEWVVCGQGVLLNVAVAGGRPRVFREARLAEMVHALDAAEPILSEIERRTGLTLDPNEAVLALPENSLVLEVSSDDAQHLVHLALAPDFSVPAGLHKMFGALEIDWAKVPIAFEIQISGPSMGIEVAAAIETGDLILLGGMFTKTRLSWPAEAAQTQKMFGRFDMLSGQFTANGTGETMESGLAQGANGNVSAGFSVPISIRLPNRMTSASELSAMRPGTTLNIGAVTQGLSVYILVGDQEIARGELVQMGDQFAVMIEQKIVHSETQSRHTEVAEGAE